MLVLLPTDHPCDFERLGLTLWSYLLASAIVFPFYIFNVQQVFTEVLCFQLQIQNGMVHFVTVFQCDFGVLSLKRYL